jgi:hypothetical protein
MKLNKYRVVLFIISSIILLYVIMVIDTNSLMGEVESAFLGEIPISETKDKPIDMYNYSSDINRYNTAYLGYRVDLTLRRVFVLHNFFFNGIMIIYYSVYVYDYEDKRITASKDIYATWIIHKENGKWSIASIIEDP